MAKKTPAAALTALLFLIFQVNVPQTVCWGIKEEESEIFTIESTVHLGVIDVLSAVKSSSYPGLCKLQKERHLQKVSGILL